MGWAVAVFLTIAASAAIAAALPVGPRPEPRQAIWDVPRVAQTFTPIVGTLAGFSVASTIFLANLAVTRESADFPSLIGMFVIAFVIFVGVAQEFGMTPNLPARDADYEHLQRLAYLLSMFGYFLALAVSWNALRILLLTLGLDGIADVFTWVLLFAVVAGTTRLSVQHLYMLTALPRATCLAIPAVSFVAAAVLRLGLVPNLPALAPVANEPFHVAVACFAVAAVGFALQSVILALHDEPRLAGLILRHGDRGAMAMLGAVGTVVGVLWIVVALA